MPAHGEPAGCDVERNGGTTGLMPPAKDPTIVMGPPQQGQGGRLAGCLADRCVGAGPRRGRDARTARMWSRPAFRFEPVRKPYVPDAVEAARQDMEQEAPDELRGRQVMTRAARPRRGR